MPVVNHVSRVFADQRRGDLFDRCGAGFGTAFEDWFPQSGDPGVGVDLQEDPPGLHEESLQFRDLEGLTRLDRRIGRFRRVGALLLFQ